MSPKTTFKVPTADEIFGTDFSFGHNAPQDSQDLHRLSGLSSTFKEKQRVQTQPKQMRSPLDSGDLSEYARSVYDWLLDNQPEPEHWQSPLFTFARFLKAHPKITELEDHESVRAIERIMRDWEGWSPGSDPWEVFFPEAGGSDAARLDFMASWNAVRHIPFCDPLSNALRLADEMPLPQQPRGRLYQRFLSLAFWLQVLFPEKPILLPTRKVGKVLACDQRTVSRLRGFAVHDGDLKISKSHSYHSGGTREATEFRFAIERYRDDRLRQLK
jgi:hypothetical protein